jgi:hypothetical protein
MRDDSRGKYQSCFLRSAVNRAQEAAATDPRSASVRIKPDSAHSREVYYQPIAGAKTCKAVPPTAEGGENSGGGSRFDRHLHIGHVCAPRYQPW